MKWALAVILVFTVGCAANPPSSQAAPQVRRIKLTPKLLCYAEDHFLDVVGQQLPTAAAAVIHGPSQVLACELTDGTYGKSVRRELFAAGTLDAPNGSGALIRQAYVIAWVISHGQPKGGYLCVPVRGPMLERTLALEKMNVFSGALQQPEPPLTAATAGNRIRRDRQGSAGSFE